MDLEEEVQEENMVVGQAAEKLLFLSLLLVSSLVKEER